MDRSIIGSPTLVGRSDSYVCSLVQNRLKYQEAMPRIAALLVASACKAAASSVSLLSPNPLVSGYLRMIVHTRRGLTEAASAGPMVPATMLLRASVIPGSMTESELLVSESRHCVWQPPNTGCTLVGLSGKCILSRPYAGLNSPPCSTLSEDSTDCGQGCVSAPPCPLQVNPTPFRPSPNHFARGAQQCSLRPFCPFS
ncbi:uncharacterized protein EI90DRAFT_2099878 [Cantharellus anzutake]|uniref:uncharacterized protein n=1 Tax=Cantharellus anzutake TaxID=1750568 RepID=UPI00190354C3|nr:uncharacterized protein EI90DRAFT_2099878 [Cantharellus anzutake]KAF8340683.1 hypothetical protein EI90DRAFT_2099878 [Cantharellus anzutake]